jgi:putative hydrolase of the HAD superfamily
MARTLLLDIGGVFYLGRPDDAFWARWAVRAGCDAKTLRNDFWNDPAAVDVGIGRLSRHRFYEQMASRYGMMADAIESMFQEVFTGDFNAPFTAYVRGLRSRGIAVSSLTNNWATEAEIKARPELAGIFDTVISSCEAGFLKPGAEIYRYALDRLGQPASEIVFVDDAKLCIDGAIAAGMHGVHFRDTQQAINEIKALI